jgi:aminopeptidase
MDYARMADRPAAAARPRRERTDRVRIVSPGTRTSDVQHRRHRRAAECDGKRNIPDGEVYTAPGARQPRAGPSSYNAPTLYQGRDAPRRVASGSRAGRSSRRTSNEHRPPERRCSTPTRARGYIGEFAIGFNPYIREPMRDILFDEKIAGSIHLTPGNAYDVAFNGNRSQIHWDLVLIQRPEYGGGELWFDDVLIRKDGIFVVPALEGLNPEHLVNGE